MEDTLETTEEVYVNKLTAADIAFVLSLAVAGVAVFVMAL